MGFNVWDFNLWFLVLIAAGISAVFTAARPRDRGARWRSVLEAISTLLVASLLVGVLLASRKIFLQEVDPAYSTWYMYLTAWWPLWLLFFAPQWLLGTWFACFRIESPRRRAVALTIVALAVPSAVLISLHWQLGFFESALVQVAMTAATLCVSLVLSRKRGLFAA